MAATATRGWAPSTKGGIRGGSLLGSMGICFALISNAVGRRVGGGGCEACIWGMMRGRGRVGEDEGQGTGTVRHDSQRCAGGSGRCCNRGCCLFNCAQLPEHRASRAHRSQSARLSIKMLLGMERCSGCARKLSPVPGAQAPLLARHGDADASAAHA